MNLSFNNGNDKPLYWTKHGQMLKENDGGIIVTTVATSQAIYDIADEYDGEVIATAVGDLLVARELHEKDGLFGGEENGGFDLISNDNTVYYETGMSDVKSYYILGKATLPVADEFEYVDESDLDNGAKQYFAGDFLTIPDALRVLKNILPVLTLRFL